MILKLCWIIVGDNSNWSCLIMVDDQAKLWIREFFSGRYMYGYSVPIFILFNEAGTLDSRAFTTFEFIIYWRLWNPGYEAGCVYSEWKGKNTYGRYHLPFVQVSVSLPEKYLDILTNHMSPALLSEPRYQLWPRDVKNDQMTTMRILNFVTKDTVVV
jgi:hypothetical protein